LLTPQQTIARARELRREQTRAEARLWVALRNRGLGGWKWKRQAPFDPDFLDFVCREAGLVVELDGGQHSEQEDYDARRTAFLRKSGFRVVRFWNPFVLADRAAVCAEILRECGGERRLDAPPQALTLPSPSRAAPGGEDGERCG
jgi:very-short-patch-repair endonuclease